MTSICDYCFWNEITHDELGAIDYCTRRDIYGDDMVDMKECLYLDDKRRVSTREVKK